MSESSEEFQNDFFEGTEKLFEVWFGTRSGNEGPKKCDLRVIRRSVPVIVNRNRLSVRIVVRIRSVRDC